MKIKHSSIWQQDHRPDNSNHAIISNELKCKELIQNAYQSSHSHLTIQIMQY
jgi:hypothetical protein